MVPLWRPCHPCPPRRRRWSQNLLQGRRWRCRRPRPSRPRLPRRRAPRSRRLLPSPPLQPLPLQLLPLRPHRRLHRPPRPCRRLLHRRRLQLHRRRHRPLPLLPPPPHCLRSPLSLLKRLNLRSLLRLPDPRHGAQRPLRRLTCRPNRLPCRRLTVRLLRSLRPSSLRSSTSRCWSLWRKPRRAAQQSELLGRRPSSRSPM